jgi:hypothetical protein
MLQQHEAQQGQLVGSRCREYSCGKRWRIDVMASHGRVTDADEVQWSTKLIMRGSKTREAQCTTLYVRDSNKRSVAKSFDQSWAYFLARFWGFQGYEHGSRRNTMDDFSILTIREPWLLKRISTSNASAWLAGGKLMLQGRRELRQGTNSTEISKRPLRRKRKATKEFQSFLVRMITSSRNFKTILLTPLLIS